MPVRKKRKLGRVTEGILFSLPRFTLVQFIQFQYDIVFVNCSLLSLRETIISVMKTLKTLKFIPDR